MASVSLNTSKNDDSCDTYFENADSIGAKETSVKSNASLNESQDFNLLMDTEKDSLNVDCSTASEPNDRVVMTEKSNDKEVEQETSQLEKEQPNKESEEKTGGDESDEEFIEGTPPLSPMKSNISLCRKRKMSTDSSTPATKVSKVSPAEDQVVNRAETECENDEMFVAESLDKASQVLSNDVIPETQENDQNECNAETSPVKMKEPMIVPDEKSEKVETEKNKVANHNSEEKESETVEDKGEELKVDVESATEIEKECSKELVDAEDNVVEESSRCLENGADQAGANLNSCTEDKGTTPKEDKTVADKQSESKKDVDESTKHSGSRYSIEVIYDKKVAAQDKKNLPEIIEIVDNSQENISGNAFFDTDPEIVDILQNKSESCNTSTDKTLKDVSLVNISDSDYDEVAAINNSLHNSKSIDEATALPSENSKIVQMEKEMDILIKLKCLVNVDENSKDVLQKEILSVNCEAVGEHNLCIARSSHDSSSSLADISGNKEGTGSPGSVTSNQPMYSLPTSHTSRLSMISTTSSSSCASSATSLAAKIHAKDIAMFALPQHTVPRTIKSVKICEPFDKNSDGQLTDWKNANLLTTTVLQFADNELTHHIMSNNNLAADRIADLQASSPTPGTMTLPTSTPDAKNDPSTPKSTRKRRQVAKRARGTKSTPSTNKVNGYKQAMSPELLTESAIDSSDAADAVSNKKPKLGAAVIDFVDEQDPLIGKQVFAKWSDNNYYPGKVIERIKTKYKVSFYDGKSKLLIEDFVIPVTGTLREGLSVYAAMSDRDYDCPGIIVKVRQTKAKLASEQTVLYTIEVDEECEKIEVPITKISLSSDQAQVLRDETENKPLKSGPSTPSTHVTLDNMVEGTRRSRRGALGGTPTSAAKKSVSSSLDKSKPSVSGLLMTPRLIIEKDSSSDFDSSSPIIVDKPAGVQTEIDGTPDKYLVKKSNGRSKSKGKRKADTTSAIKEDAALVQLLGPIPPSGSNFFAGMSFVLTCASVENIDKYLHKDSASSSENYGTDNEEDWIKEPFVRDRLKAQLVAAGGLVYDNVQDIPEEDYANTRLITNVPNCTAKSIECLSLGIKTLNHNWVIRCCRENKQVNMDQEELPAGWSLDKNAYVESYQRQSNKPLSPIIIAIPNMKEQVIFHEFWSKICKNAGANVISIENPESNFVEATVVLATKHCPSYILEKASQWEIPVLSSTWLVQCLIEGKLCSFDTQPSYVYTYVRP